MTNEISEIRGLWRGKRVDNGKWVEGYLSKSRNAKEKPTFLKYCIDREETGLMMSYIVVPETLGECTGLRDKNGKLIFVGDIIDYENPDGIYTYMVVWDNEYARFAIADDWFGETKIISDFEFYSANKCTVIGNVHDNPDLINAK